MKMLIVCSCCAFCTISQNSDLNKIKDALFISYDESSNTLAKLRTWIENTISNLQMNYGTFNTYILRAVAVGIAGLESHGHFMTVNFSWDSTRVVTFYDMTSPIIRIMRYSTDDGWSDIESVITYKTYNLQSYLGGSYQAKSSGYVVVSGKTVTITGVISDFQLTSGSSVVLGTLSKFYPTINSLYTIGTVGGGAETGKIARLRFDNDGKIYVSGSDTANSSLRFSITYVTENV